MIEVPKQIVVRLSDNERAIIGQLANRKAAIDPEYTVSRAVREIVRAFGEKK